MKRYAIYYAPEAGAFADAAAAWLGWDAGRGESVAQPAPNLPRPLADLTLEPRRYGFHGTLKPPFRLADGIGYGDLCAATAALAATLRRVVMPGLELVQIEGFLALVPQGDQAALRTLAAEVVRGLEPCRAPLNADEIAHRRPERLTARQRALLAEYGYPHVMEEFRFHLTLSGPLSGAESPAVARAAAQHFQRVLPQPFVLRDLCLFGEDDRGRFHLLHRYALND